MGLLEELAVRCEAAKAEALPIDLMRDAFEAVHGPKPPRLHGGSDDLTEWLRKFNPFFYMLEARAYESAAMMLIPEGWHTRLATEDRHSHSWRWELRGGYGVNIGARAATPALALTAASLRARHALALSKGSDT